ncbi:hypothetical protein [Spirillospora sp. CA-294931]|uniref:hypothetical protein n=1 Tax=Spirillospora sp. CA-294931 TaxID=3240042 RepID=UPI003D92376D
MKSMTVTATAWHVASETHSGVVYTVTASTCGEMTCTCADFRFRRPTRDAHECKHIEVVREDRGLNYAGVLDLITFGLSGDDIKALAAASDAMARLASAGGR